MVLKEGAKLLKLFDEVSSDETELESSDTDQ